MPVEAGERAEGEGADSEETEREETDGEMAESGETEGETADSEETEDEETEDEETEGEEIQDKWTEGEGDADEETGEGCEGEGEFAANDRAWLRPAAASRSGRTRRPTRSTSSWSTCACRSGGRDRTRCTSAAIPRHAWSSKAARSRNCSPAGR
jgi:hypothetical protein